MIERCRKKLTCHRTVSICQTHLSLQIFPVNISDSSTMTKLVAVLSLVLVVMVMEDVLTDGEFISRLTIYLLLAAHTRPSVLRIKPTPKKKTKGGGIYISVWGLN